MSEQEKKSGLTAAGGSAVVLVEQSPASRHKQPYRPTELHEEAPPDLQHKRTKAPAVPSMTEELKDSTDSPEMKDQRESDRAMSSEKFKHKLAKKLSSNTKRRGSSPEAIKLAPIEVETKKDTSSLASQPIPPEVSSVVTDQIPEKVGAQKRADEDSIIEEVAEVRTPELDKRSSEWISNDQAPDVIKKKEISWASKNYLDKTPPQDLGEHSYCTLLERKASIGPCFRLQNSGVPSGISIYIPKKSNSFIHENVTSMPSVINIAMSKKCLADRSRSTMDCDRRGATGEGSSKTKKNSAEKSKSKIEIKHEEVSAEGSGENQIDEVRVTKPGFLKGKINAMTEKIRNALKI